MKQCVAVHGGVGLKTEEDEEKVKPFCQQAAQAGWDLLEAGGSALEAVVASCVVLEDNQRFNAGTGSRIRLNGWIEMDAALMDSRGRYGAVAAIQSVKNPIKVAERVLETPAWLIAGDGATDFARRCGFKPHNPWSPRAQRIYEKVLERMESGKLKKHEEGWKEFRWHDTIGAVAMDSGRNFAAGNSTGGVPMVIAGRVGDSPIPGAGLWAGKMGAVVTTGIGEEILRQQSAKMVYDLLKEGLTLQQAADSCISDFPEGYSLGILAVDTREVAIAKTHAMGSAVIME